MATEEMALLAELTEIPEFGDLQRLTRTQDVMLALGLGLTAHLDPMASEPMHRRERRRTGDSPRARYDPEEYDTADRSRSRKGSRIAPSGSPKQSGTRNHAMKRGRLGKEGLGGGVLGVRKLYLCRWCGLPKKNHTCEGAVDPELLASRQQARTLTAPRRDAMSSSSSTGSTAEEEGGGADEIETVVAPSPKLRAWQQSRKELRRSVDTHASGHACVEAPTAEQAVGKRIEGVFLCEGASLQWYGGLITEFSESSAEHLVVYDDGEQKWHNLVEGMAQRLLRWPDAQVGADDGSPATISSDQRKGGSLGSRKRRERPVAPEPALAERDAPAAQVCDYCNSRGKVHRRCVRLPTCHLVWKRGGKKKRDSIDISDLRRSTLSTPPMPAAEPIRTGREKGVSPGKRAQVMNARGSESTTMQPDVDDEDDMEEVDDFEEALSPLLLSQDWPFPVIVAPEALGISFPGVAMAATATPSKAGPSAEGEGEAAEGGEEELVEHEHDFGLHQF